MTALKKVNIDEVSNYLFFVEWIEFTPQGKLCTNNVPFSLRLRVDCVYTHWVHDRDVLEWNICKNISPMQMASFFSFNSKQQQTNRLCQSGRYCRLFFSSQCIHTNGYTEQYTILFCRGTFIYNFSSLFFCCGKRVWSLHVYTWTCNYFNSHSYCMCMLLNEMPMRIHTNVIYRIAER